MGSYIMNGNEVISSSLTSYSSKGSGGSYNRQKRRQLEGGFSTSSLSSRSLNSPLHRTRSNSPATLEKKLITLTREETGGLGFTLRGGVEHGLGHFVSAVEQGSVACKQGLKPGDQIVSFGGLSLIGATHKEVVSLISSSKSNTLVSLSFDISAS